MNRSICSIPFVALFMTILVVVPARAQHKETSTELKAKAKVSETAATKTALEAVPGGKVTVAELGEEAGKVVYTIDVKLEGVDGVERIQVDATTGKVLSHKHEKDPDEVC